MGDPVVHFEIAGSDGEQLGSFYGELFGWKVDVVASSGGAYRLVDTGAEGPNGGIGSFPGVPAYLTFYVKVADLEASLGQAESLGAMTVMAPREVAPGVRAAMFHDPQGNMIGMMSSAPADGA